MFRITEINDIAELSPHAGDWAAPLARTPHASFFQSLPWLQAHWKHVGAERRLRVLLAWDGNELAGVLPLNVQIEKTQLGAAQILAFPIDGWGSFYGPIGPDPHTVLESGLAYLRESKRDYDLIDLRAIPAVGNTAIENNQDGWSVFSEVAVIDLNDNWDTYWESRRQDYNRRRNVERCERRLAEQGKITYVRYRPLGKDQGDADLRWDLYDACEQLARKSWQSGLINGNTLSHETVRDFVRHAHQAAADNGALDLNLLYLDQRPVAFVYAYHYRGYVDLMRIGFDPELQKLAPGNALWTRMIRDSYDRGDRVFDCGPTCLDYKRFWMNRVEPSYRLMHYPPSPKAQSLRIARWVKERFAPKTEETNQGNKELALKNLTMPPLTTPSPSGRGSG